MSKNRQPKRDKALLVYEILGLIGAGVGVLLAILKTVVIHARTCGSTIINPEHVQHAPRVVTSVTSVCFGQPIVNDLVQYGVPAVGGLFAGFLVALPILALHRAFAGPPGSRDVPPKTPPDEPSA